MKIPVVWVSYKKETPHRGYWDMEILEDIFKRQTWNPVNGNEFEHFESVQEMPRQADGCIVVLPARHHAHEMYANRINDELARFAWVIIMIVGDEENSFPTFLLKHRNMRLYIMMPRERQHHMKHTGLPNGYPTGVHEYLAKFKTEQMEKKLNWFFAGQDVNARRHVFVEYAMAIGGMPNEDSCTGGVLIPTEGFTLGLPREEYYRLMAKAKVVPCPSGAVAPDSFRLYEALEAGCVPLADNYYAWEDYTSSKSYWTFMFGEKPPFPTVDEWRQFPRLLIDALADWPANANRIGAWWISYKKRLTEKLETDINELRGLTPEAKTVKDKITVLISSSPIPSHPSPWMILETIASVRAHLPECEILILQDGIRPEQEHMRAVYEEYKRQLLHNIRNEQHNVLPIFFDEFLHQAEMTRRALDQVKTPHILFMEHDTPLCEDKLIEWDGIVRAIESGWTDLIRLHHLDCGFIHNEHMHLMIDKTPQEICGIKAMRTRQWSQRPHVATVNLYRRVLSTLSENSRTFIEDPVYGQYYDNKTPYNIAVYTPSGHIKRSRDLNGREGGEKFADRLIY
jgi:hypothetical protein